MFARPPCGTKSLSPRCTARSEGLPPLRALRTLREASARPLRGVRSLPSAAALSRCDAAHVRHNHCCFDRGLFLWLVFSRIFSWSSHLYGYTVPEIVHVNRIIKFIWYYWRGGEDNQMLKIIECANVWFLRFPDFKVENCIEFVVNSHCSL